MCHVSSESLVLTFCVGLILCNYNKHILIIVFNSKIVFFDVIKAMAQ